MSAQPSKKKVFIIHGRNIAARNAVEMFVRALALEPLDFDQVAADLGGSVFIGDVVRAGLKQAQAIVAIFTPDECAALHPAFRSPTNAHEDLRWQARPNVIFEAGMAYGMSPERTVLVTFGHDVRLFSDVSGIHIVPVGNDVKSRGKLRQKLIGIGCAIDERADAWTDAARSGDFEGCVIDSQLTARDPFGSASAQ
jgi:predicted nucleotide-binding protein